MEQRDAVGNYRMYGGWQLFSTNEKPPTYRQVLMAMLTAPDVALDSPVYIPPGPHPPKSAIQVILVPPRPHYDDPFGEKGFVSYKFYTEVKDDVQG